MMKIKFNDRLDFQLEAIQSITDIFAGMENGESNFSVSNNQAGAIKFTDTGIGNKINLIEEEILDNVKKIQLRNGLKQSTTLGSYDFSIEMETGTGKSYIYLRTIFELYKNYKFTKFIVVVPSIAIKEGINKTIEITQEHFKNLYDNVPYDYFIYDSQRLEQVRSFATSENIQIMIINIDAFRRSFIDPNSENKANIIHRYHDKLGCPPIELIKETSPIVIIDEPQSVDNTEKAKEAIASLNPLFTLRYSATHKDKYNLMYKLDSVDAYEKKLVKQIEVSSVKIENNNNLPYIKLLKVNNTGSPIKAHIEIDILQNGKVVRTKKWVKQNDDLSEITKRQLYNGFIIKDIYCEKGNEYIDFTSREEIIRLGEAIGSVNDLEIKTAQIRKTIEKHLEKELY